MWEMKKKGTHGHTDWLDGCVELDNRGVERLKGRKALPRELNFVTPLADFAASPAKSTRNDR
jgi:hypothetical protein